jgi:hypothetical protein
MNRIELMAVGLLAAVVTGCSSDPVGGKNSIRTLLGDKYAKNWDILVAINMRKSVTILSQYERYLTLRNVIERYQIISYVIVLFGVIL